MKRSTFKQGAIIATFAIIFTKFLGIIYVIPFYKIIGNKGGALYGYAYNIYSVFLSLSTVGIPLAISKLVSEYNALGYYHTRENVFKQGRKVILFFASVIFMLLFIFSSSIARLIIGDITGGNTIKDIQFVIRVIATAILVIPSLSILRGYLQGNKYIETSSFSQVIEQTSRVLIVVLGSYIALKITGSITIAVSVACFGATIGGIAALFYLSRKVKNNKDDFIINMPMKSEESLITNKVIWKKIVKYAVPFVMIDVVGNACNLINMFTVVKILVKHCNWNINNAEIVMSTLTTWGSKLNMIIIALATGLVVSLLPHVTSSYIRKDMDTVKKYINEAYSLLLYLAIPMTIGLSFLSKPVWQIFYGNHGLAAEVFSVFVFNALTSSLYTVTLTIMQSINRYKVVFYSLFLEVFIKLILQYPLMILAYKLGFGPYIGNISATIIATSSTFIISMTYMVKKMNISLYDTFKDVLKIVLYTFVMFISLKIVNVFIPLESSSRFKSIIIIAIYTIVGGSVYLIVSFKTFKKVFGKDIINNIKNKFKAKKEV